MDLAELRGRLDGIDREITSLYLERMVVCAEVAEDKQKSGKAVYDPAREAEKLRQVAEMARTPFEKNAIQELYSQIMAISRRLQLGILSKARSDAGSSFGFRRISLADLDLHHRRVVYQGVEGAYAHLAAMRYFAADSAFSAVETWRDAMERVRAGGADYAVLPIENSTRGVIADNFDLLLDYPEAAILAEVELPVEHALMGLPGAAVADLREVCSHPQALEQCGGFFKAHQGVRALPMLNTAVAAQHVASSGDRQIAAIASPQAAGLYGLSVLQYAVNDAQDNKTRFLVLGREKAYREDARRISLCFEAAHSPGALYNVLGNFLFNAINMTMILSRPIPEKSFEYRFFVDIEGNLEDSEVRNALYGISDQTAMLRILGCY